MSQFFISCKESRIERNRSFYGCFYLGPFEPSQSITIANTLRRTLLSEIYGLAIVSVEIEGAVHEYSSLPGVRESVLDILLNLKEIVLKKTIKNFTPQIGYLRARGPGVVSASHLKLPPFIQCVDPDQYIANLSHNGFLNLKFIIQYGNKWLSPVTSVFQTSNDSIPEEPREGSIKRVFKEKKTRFPITYNVFNFFFKKRRLFLKKLQEIGLSGSNSYINMFSSRLFPGTMKSSLKKKRDIILKCPNLGRGDGVLPNPALPFASQTACKVRGHFLRSKGRGFASQTVGPLYFALQQKGGMRRKIRVRENLNLILKISQKYPGINFKNGLLLAKSYFGHVLLQSRGAAKNSSDASPLHPVALDCKARGCYAVPSFRGLQSPSYFIGAALRPLRRTPYGVLLAKPRGRETPSLSKACGLLPLVSLGGKARGLALPPLSLRTPFVAKQRTGAKHRGCFARGKGALNPALGELLAPWKTSLFAKRGMSKGEHFRPLLCSPLVCKATKKRGSLTPQRGVRGEGGRVRGLEGEAPLASSGFTAQVKQRSSPWLCNKKRSFPLESKKRFFFNINPLNIEAIFNPISKINYIIEINDLKIAQTKIKHSCKSSELYETFQKIPRGLFIPNISKSSLFLPPQEGETDFAGDRSNHSFVDRLYQSPASPSDELISPPKGGKEFKKTEQFHFVPKKGVAPIKQKRLEGLRWNSCKKNGARCLPTPLLATQGQKFLTSSNPLVLQERRVLRSKKLLTPQRGVRAIQNQSFNTMENSVLLPFGELCEPLPLDFDFPGFLLCKGKPPIPFATPHPPLPLALQEKPLQSNPYGPLFFFALQTKGEQSKGEGGVRRASQGPSTVFSEKRKPKSRFFLSRREWKTKPTLFSLRSSNPPSRGVRERSSPCFATKEGVKVRTSKVGGSKDSVINKDLANLLQLNQEISPLTKDTIKHNILLEIWTNGSIHPRDALFQAFKNLIKIFAKLKKVQPFGPLRPILKEDDVSPTLLISPPPFLLHLPKEASFPFHPQTLQPRFVANQGRYPLAGLGFPRAECRAPLQSKPFALFPCGLQSKEENCYAPLAKQAKQPLCFVPVPPKGDGLLRKGWGGGVGAVRRSKGSSSLSLREWENKEFKKIKMGQLNSKFIPDLQPLNETCFLSTYMNPKIKNYYLNKQNLSIILKAAIETNFAPPN